MDERLRPRVAAVLWSILLAVGIAVALVLVLVALLEDGGFGSDQVRDLAVPLLGVLLAALATGLWASRREARATTALLEAERHARRSAEGALTPVEEQLEQLKADHERDTARLKREVDAARAAHRRAEQAKEVEKEWVQELRAQVHRAHRSAGALGTGDVRDLVVRIAMELTGAQKGLLLEDVEGPSDGEGRLHMGAQVGFEDPEAAKQLADPLARRTLSRDETIREDGIAGFPVYVADEVNGCVILTDREGGFDDCEDELLLSLGDHAGHLLSSGRMQGELRAAYLATVGVLASAIEVKDPFVRSHSEDVVGLVAAVADRLRVPSERREPLVFASLLHDVGKLGISERILCKPAALTQEERAIIELHPRIGFRLVEQVPALREIAPAVLHHHERWDGAGYPVGLAGAQIPLEARIVCVADAFSAMTADRPYREAMLQTDACEELARGAGTQFDPEVVEAFLEVLRAREPFGPPRAALADQELAAMRAPGEPTFGAGAAAVVDPTTLLFSHRHLQEAVTAEAQRAAVQGRPFTVAVGRLEGLEETNREQGFAAGDARLRAAADAFAAAAAEHPGSVAGRLSGDRLALVVPREDDDLADGIRAHLDGESDVAFGAATWAPGDDGAAVLARARAIAARA